MSTDTTTLAPPAPTARAGQLRAFIGEALQALAIAETGQPFPGDKAPLDLIAAGLSQGIAYLTDRDTCPCEPGKPCCGEHAADDREADVLDSVLSLLAPGGVS
jgi:hypothetical protein